MHLPIWPEHLFKPAAALADPSRAAMLAALLDGTAQPAGDLAQAAGIGASAASAHLARLRREGFIVVEQQGRHRYYRLASAEVAAALETMASLMPQPAARSRHGDPSLWRARLCYHLLAGRLGVALRESLIERKWLRVDGDSYQLDASGRKALQRLGILATDTPIALPGRLCLDWTERRHHIGGPLGRELAHGLIERVHWLRSGPHRRALVPTAIGLAALSRELGVDPRVLNTIDS
ncbi:MAG TPA: helix-turn-helix transcriptional regulator [Rhodanobacteraceae bacterium]